MNVNVAPLWTPSPEAVRKSEMVRFMGEANRRFGLALADYRQLHAWSIDNLPAFWELVWDFCGVIGEKGTPLLSNGNRMPGAKFFPGARLSFAENMMRKTGAEPAMIFRGEDKKRYQLTFDELHALVSRLQQAMKAAGVTKGDRVAAMLPNLPESVAIMLAASSLGAIFSSCSPDFGERGVIDRFGQIQPKLFFSCDGYWYAGKKIEIASKLDIVTKNLLTAEKVIIVPYLGEAKETAAKLSRATDLDSFIAPFAAKKVEFERLPFDHPLYILFSSGTTGVPKCIVHGQGGILLQHLKEHKLHCGIKPGDRMFWFTTMGWMMWNWLVTGLAAEATLMLYDGSPFHPKQDVIFDYAAEEKIDFLGTSAKFIDAAKKANLRPKDTHDFSKMRVLASTGSPLVPESFDYVYDAVKNDVHLASVSGGTDLAACFVGADPTGPVWKGEIQAAALGMAVDVWDDSGKPIARERGELVCTRPFPSMPVMFWNDPDGKKYHGAYFDRFPNTWCHGDFAEWTEHGGMVIHGRSDATLNPQGVRIGTAEIYAQVEQIAEVVESIAIGQEWEGDTRIVLFVRLRDGMTLNDALMQTIKQQIRVGASPRHVPAKIVQIADIPRTRSGKITELAVRDVVHGRPVKNTEALANPEALALYRDLPALRN
jgi:acetoacetyl-CoA synthetase